MSPFWSRKKPIKGEIGSFGLEDWWLATFSDEERQHIEETTGSSLTSGEITWMEESANAMLQELAGWFSKEGEEQHIAYRMLEKAEELAKELPISSIAAVLDRHFLYDQEIKLYYKDRDKPEYLEKTIEACKKQIALAPRAATAFKHEYEDDYLPYHTGYERLTFIFEKQKKYKEAIDLYIQAGKQGWFGDCKEQIASLKDKLAKQQASSPVCQ